MRADAPDFLIVGWKKCGTTSLINWLGAHPGVCPPERKEPAFFSDERSWERGWSWYQDQLGAHPDGRLTGEASTSYADPAYAERVAGRLAEHAPGCRLIALFREPFERVVSHYEHQQRRGRRAIPFREAAAQLTVDDVEIRNSLYRSGIEPFTDAFGEQLLLIRTDSLRHEGWGRALHHLELAQIPVPQADSNVGRSSVAYRFHHVGLMREFNRLRPLVPAPVARLGRRIVVRSSDSPAYPSIAREEIIDLLRPEVVERIESEYRWVSDRAATQDGHTAEEA